MAVTNVRVVTLGPDAVGETLAHTIYEGGGSPFSLRGSH